MGRRWLADLLLIAAVAATGGCGPMTGIQLADDAPPAPADCAADRYLFAGRSTLRTLGLVGRSRAPLPEPDRPAMIWVTADLLPFDAGPPGGEPERTRMLCFEFDDGSGGSEWPVDAAWLPPGSASAASSSSTILDLLPIVLALLAFVAVGALAFRRR